MSSQAQFSKEPTEPEEHIQGFDKFYTRFALGYDWLVKTLPVWKNWIAAAIPWIKGPDVLEVSFGTGYLLCQYADRFNSYGIDYNQRLARIANSNLRRTGKSATLLIGDVGALPYKSETFDTLVNTMAFTAYPDGNLAFSEMSRVLKPRGRIVMVDICYPLDGNLIGRTLTKAWKASGDIIRDMPLLFKQFNFDFTDEEIGGYGSVHLFVAYKPEELSR